MGSFLYTLYQKITQRKRFSLVALLVIAAGLLFMVSKISFEEDITKLIPVNTENKEYQKVLKTVKFTDKIIVHIQRDSKSAVADMISYATVFLDSISKQKAYIENIQGKVSDTTIFGTLDFVYANLPLFLEEADYQALENKIHADSIEKITKQNYKTLISPTGLIAKKTILKDPLGLSFIGLKKLQNLGIGDDFILKDGFLLSKDEQNILLFITPKYPSSETDKNTAFSKTLYTLQEQLNKQYNNVSSTYFGTALVAVANANQIKKDIQFTVSIALTLLLILLIFFYRKLTVPILLFLPTLFGGLLSIAILYLLRDTISAISLGIGSVLLGVTLDYSLHILTHIRNNKSIKSLYLDVAPSILMSSVTTASAFLCLLFINSQALQDLGVFAAISVLGASVFALLVLPQIYQATEKRSVQKNVLDQIASYQIHKNKIVLGLLIIVFIVSAFTYDKVVFNTDIAKMNYEPEALVQARTALESLTDLGVKSVYAATYANSLEAALQKNDSLFSALDAWKKNGSITNFSSIGALVSSQKKQQQKIARWHAFWKANRALKTKENLIESGNSLGFKPETFNSFYQLLDKDFTSLSLSDYNAISALSMGDFIATKENFTTITSMIKVGSTMEATELKNKIEANSDTIVIDRQGMNETFLGNLKNDFNRLIGYSVLVVLVLLFLFYRSFSITLVTGLPIFLTWFITIGVMGWLHIEFNIFNIIISTFIFGLGVDYSIFITNALLAENRTGEKVMPTHKTSILLSVITTILGVGVLIFAKHPALYTISLVSLVGILSAVLIAFTVQPLLFKLFIGDQTKRPISIRLFVHSVLSFTYFGLGGLVVSFFSILLKIIPVSKKIKMGWFHKAISKLMGSVLYTNRFVSKKRINLHQETFKKPVMLVANHTSFLDILAIGMLHPKIIFLVNDWVYNSPVFGKAVQAAGFYPVSKGIENAVAHLQEKVAQGYSLITFPEGTRSKTNKIKRFHKGAFYLAQELNLDIVPVLIHGNSEVLPKGSFIIRDGSITIKALDKVAIKDATYGETAREKTKQISALFKKQFQCLRKEVEDAYYFHPLVLLEYRYKGGALYEKVKEDLKTNAQTYKALLDYIDAKAHILHISTDVGALDFLLKLDAPDRKLNTFITDQEARQVAVNSYITYNYGKLDFPLEILDAFKEGQQCAIINMVGLAAEVEKALLQSKIRKLIVLKEGKSIALESFLKIGFIIDKEIPEALFLKREVVDE